MRKRSIWEYICISGIPWIPILTVDGIAIKLFFCWVFGRPYLISYDDVRFFVGTSVPLTLMIFLKNMIWMRSPRKIGLMTWLNKYDFEPMVITERKQTAMYPPIDEEYLSPIPDGLVLGKKGSNFVRYKLEKHSILNTIIMGSSGCGKSVLLLTYLLFQFHISKDPATAFVVDIKPELARKSVVIKGNKNVRVMNPDDRYSWGWDVYYRLSDNSTNDEILSELDLIARALIDVGKGNERNKFFYISARNIFKGVMFFTFKQGLTFMQGLNYLIDSSISDVITNTLVAVEGRVDLKPVKRLLSPYKGKQGEAFQDIEMTFRESLDIFTQENIQYFLDINPRKVSPMTLEDKVSIFFGLNEFRIEEYPCLLRLVTMQIMNHCSRRSEDSHIITLIIDEAFRLGSINWVSFLSTSRSRQVATILAFQSLSQMQGIWGMEDAKSLIELCRVIAVLSCSDPDTANMLSSWVSEFKEQNHSVTDKGNVTTSYTDKKVFQPSDIMTLQDQEEVILFIKGKYFRTDVARARYYNIKELSIISEKCKKINDKEVQS